MVCIDFRDELVLKVESNEGKVLGFDGKQVIHPSQLAIVNKYFSPEPERVDEAAEIIDMYLQHSKSHRGAFDYNGRVVDLPGIMTITLIDLVVKQCQRLLEKHRMIQERAAE